MSSYLFHQARRAKLPKAQRAVLEALCDAAGEDDGTKCYPSQEYLAWQTDLSIRHVRRILQDLERLQYITSYALQHTGWHRTKFYLIHMEQVPMKPSRRDVKRELRAQGLLEADPTEPPISPDMVSPISPDMVSPISPDMVSPISPDMVSGKLSYLVTNTSAAAAADARARANPPAAVIGQDWQALADTLIQDGTLAPLTNRQALARSLQESGLGLIQARVQADAAADWWTSHQQQTLTLARWQRWLATRKPTEPTENQNRQNQEAGPHGEPTAAQTNRPNWARPARPSGSGPDQGPAGESESATARALDRRPAPARPGGRGAGRNRQAGGFIEHSPEWWDEYARQIRAQNGQQQPQQTDQED